MSHALSFIREPSRSPAVALNFIQRALTSVARSWQRRRRFAHVVELDDHLLADIGLSPEDVRSALPFSAYKAGAAVRLLREAQSGRS